LADNNSHSDRGRDLSAWDNSRQAASDPLAELARLIGQSDTYAEANRHRGYDSERARDSVPVHSVGWAAEEDHVERYRRVDERYAPTAPTPGESYAPQECSCKDNDPAAGRYFSGPAATFDGFRGETGPTDAYDSHEPSTALPARSLPAYATAEPHDEYEDDQLEYRGEETYAADDDCYDEAQRPRRRSGLVVVMAVVGLIVVGAAGAFGYRAMFGGSVLPTLPPIIKAGNGPNKIMPATGDSPADGSTQAGATTTGSTENLVSREEQPVNIVPPKTAPRVVAAIPIITGHGTLPPGIGAPAVPDTPAPLPAAPAAVAAPPAAPAPAAAPTPAPPTPAQASTEPKKIHTVTIKGDQPGSADASAAPPVARAAARAASPAPRPSAAASPLPIGSNAPLSIVSGTGVQAAASSGGYSVQITSQRSEAEAKASFRELRAKFPTQLGGREAIIRRADLGDKGTYYRALVGPFASAEQATALCSGLKAAGGSCIVQKN
jgi:SPOR domain